MVKKHILLLAFTYSFHFSLLSNESNASSRSDKIKIDNINIQVNPIFNEEENNVFFIHSFANAFHVNTRQSTILRLLNTKEQEEINPNQLNEIERVLRSQHYIRDSKVTLIPTEDDKKNTLLIETWDNWSLLPTLSLGRSGGENKFAIGVKEDNLLGLGIITRFNYKYDGERKGYKFAFNTPLKWMKNTKFNMNIYNNSDGESKSLSFIKPFYYLSDKYSFDISFLDGKQIDTLLQNGKDVNKYTHEYQSEKFKLGWLHRYNEDYITRWFFGVNHEIDSFYHSESSRFYNDRIPINKDFLYPWFEFNYIENNFTILNNIYLINFSEDINLGWQYSAQLGVETQFIKNNALGYHIKGKIQKGYTFNNNLILLKINLKSRLNTKQKDYYKLGLQAEYFYQITEKWKSYNRIRFISSKNSNIDESITLGDNSGLRGYPNDYQHGDHQWLFTSEVRNYPNINLYQFAELGWALFTDIGKAFGPNSQNNFINSPIGSIGIGARLSSSRSSFAHVTHLDITVPFKNESNVNNWEWRVQIKSYF